jgi:fucose permease
MAVIPLAPTLWLLLGLMFLLGAAESTLDIGANTLLVWVHGNAVAPYLNVLHSIFGVGALTAPIIVALLKNDITVSYFAVAVLLLPLVIFTYRLPSPRPSAVKGIGGKSEKADTGLLLLMSTFLLLYVGAEIGFAGWIYTYAVEFRLSGPGAAAYLASFFWGALTVGRVLTVPAAVRCPATAMLITSVAASIGSVLIILLQPKSYAFLIVGTVGLGLSMAPIFPSALSFARSRMNLTGRITGVFILGSSLGSMIIPLIIGQVFTAAGQRVFPIAICATLFLSLIVLIVMVRLHRRW